MIRIKLKAVLAEKGIKQKDLVEMTGIRQPTLSGMNNNSVKHIPLDVLDKLCTVLDCQPADLLEFVPDENEKKPGRLTHPGRRGYFLRDLFTV